MLQKKDEGDWMKRSMLYEVAGVRNRERPRVMWNQVVEKNIGDC